MLKINPINHNESLRQIEFKKSKATTKPELVQIPPEKALGTGFNNKSMISFTGLDFYGTLIKDYFQLGKYSPDEYQRKAASKLYQGKDVLVTAPTGTGKTAIAHYVITKNMEDEKRTFYTTPLKALSNEKYRDLKKIYGEENVGILTGDVKENTDAPIIVMTTEVYRNMVFGDKFKGASPQLDNLKTVIFDELHYLGDIDRGGIWEQSIMLSDTNTQLLSLSATIGNNGPITDWMSKVKGKKTELIDVPPERRHVPLEFDNIKVEPKKAAGKKGETEAVDGGAKKSYPTPDKQSYLDVVKTLYRKDKLPAILFVFSKKESRDLLSKMTRDGDLLTNKAEREKIQDIIDKYKKEGKYLGESLNEQALLRGYAIHNSGLLPVQKELVEELFQHKDKLLKVVIATETLSAGINMPARTVVISSSRKPASVGNADGDDHKRELTPNEFHQMAGRAGRRGKDVKGFVYTMSTSKEQMDKFKVLKESSPNELQSNFKPDFSFIASYYQNTDKDDVIKELFEKSLFAYDKSQKKSLEKQNTLMKIFADRKDILQDFGYINDDNSLNLKGNLLSRLNGYYQIPIIEMVANQDLADMTPIELAGAVGAMANIDEKVEFKKQDGGEKKEELFAHRNEKIVEFVQDFDATLDKYNEKMQGSANFAKIAQNKNVAKHIFEWADLNSQNPDPRQNWKDLYRGELEKTIRDEGSLFKSVTMTVDLLKQMSGVVDIALKNVAKPEDVMYYKDLKQNTIEAIKLLQKEPIV